MTLLMSVLLLLAPQRPAATDLKDGVVRTYSKMNDFSAKFEQIRKDSSNQPHMYRGLLYLKKGKKMLFEFQEPAKDRKVIYSDGKTYVEYTPERRQAIQSPLKKADDDKIQLFQIPWNPEWKDQFEKTALGGSPLTPGNYVLQLYPRKKDLPVILLEVDSKYMIHRFVTTSPDGETNEFRFTDIKTAPLDEAMFQFKKPNGVELIVEK